MFHRPSHPLQYLVDRLQIKFLRMYRISRPFPIVLKFLMPWLEDDLQKLLVPVRPADILWWTPPPTAEADRSTRTHFGTNDLFKQNPVPPVVAKIVGVGHRVTFPQEHLPQRHLALIIPIFKFLIGHTSILAILLKLVQMAVGPTEDGLESVMEAAQGHRTRNQDAPPDWRLDAKQGDLQLVDRWLDLGGGHERYCPPGTGNCRNRPGERFPGTVWTGQYWRQDASR